MKEAVISVDARNLVSQHVLQSGVENTVNMDGSKIKMDVTSVSANNSHRQNGYQHVNL